MIVIFVEFISHLIDYPINRAGLSVCTTGCWITHRIAQDKEDFQYFTQKLEMCMLVLIISALLKCF